jgi:multicomponent Na+:H+ antiporter subunit E
MQKKLSIYNLTLSFISLMTFWFVMSGLFDWFHIILGVISVSIVMAVNYQLKQTRFFEDEMDDLKELRIHYAVYYVFWLIIQIFISGIHVASVILRPRMPIHPHIIKFRVDLPSAHARMILGNSITLTPGTLTIEIRDDQFTVHALTAKSFESIVDESIPGRVLKLFTKEEHQVIHDLRIYDAQEESK